MSLSASQFVYVVSGRAIHPLVKGRMTRAEFAAHGEAAIRTLVNASKIIRRKAEAKVVRIMHAAIMANVRQVIHNAEHRTRSGKAAVVLDLPVNVGVWLDVIREVMAQEGITAQIEVLPVVQSVAGQAASKTDLILGTSPGNPAQAVTALLHRSREIAKNVTGINATTRDKMREMVLDAAQDGKTSTDLAKDMLTKFETITPARARTIARTEMSNAWNDGTILSMKQGGMVTEVSVVGCESREQDRWGKPYFAQYLYNGEGTCNIKDVPIKDADDLEFHPNHTGVIIPSAFKDT